MDKKKVDRVVGFVGDLLAIIALCLLYYLVVTALVWCVCFGAGWEFRWELGIAACAAIALIRLALYPQEVTR